MKMKGLFVGGNSAMVFIFANSAMVFIKKK